MRNFYNQVPPKYRTGIWSFLAAGIGIALLVFGVIIFSYLLVCGALIGGALFLISWIHQKFFTSNTQAKANPKSLNTFEFDPISNTWVER